jgi:hypothetical protein
MPPISRIALALALLAGAAPATVTLTASSPAPKTLTDAADAANRGDCASALRLISTELGRAKSANLPEEFRLAADEIGAACAASTNKEDLAYRYAFEGTKFEHSSDLLWRLRLGVELSTNRLDDALTTVEAMANGRGAALNAVPVDWFFNFDRRLKDKKDVAGRRRLLAVITASAYQPDEPAAGIDYFRKDYAGLLYEAGDKGAAAALIKLVELPRILNQVGLDPRFRDLLPADYSARKTVEAYLAHLRAIQPDHRDSLNLVIEIAEQERQLGRGADALATLQAAQPTGANGHHYVDLDDRLNWWWNGISHAQQTLGHYDEAVAALRQGADARENGDLNVSQTINLAQVQLRFGHAQDVLATLAVFDKSKRPISPFGEMAMRANRGCAAKLAGKSDAADADIAYARKHADDAAGALTELLLCTGDLDGAAATLIHRLDDPEERAAALLLLSDFAAPADNLPPDPIYRNLPALKARPDVQAAIAKAGGTRRFDLRRDDM